MIRVRDYWKEYKQLKGADNDDEIMHLDPFGRVATHYISDCNAEINIAVGAIRSGKTIAAIVKFIQFILDSKYTLFAMAGKTLKSLNRNVIKPLKGILRFLGINYTHHRFDGEIDIYHDGKTKTIVLYSIEKSGSEEVIAGSTYAGALMDEVTRMTKDGVDMMVSRCSLPGAQIFMTCNPAAPQNHIYTNYVSKADLQDDNYVSVTTFLLEDNKSLPERYINYVKSIYPPESVFYKRNILGKWASGQGLIYSRFDENNIYDEDMPLDYYDYIDLGSDYGASSTTCWTMIGVKEFPDHVEFDIINEDGHDAKREGYSITDSEVVERILQMQDKYELGRENIFYVSHDATSLETELKNNKEVKMEIQKFKPDLLESIEKINNLFYHNQLRIHSRCTNLIRSIESYEWNIKKAEAGVDEPVKIDDHYVDAMRAPIMNYLPGESNEILGDFLYI
jgi:PBSX family phage terminase large subunit